MCISCVCAVSRKSTALKRYYEAKNELNKMKAELQTARDNCRDNPKR